MLELIGRDGTVGADTSDPSVRIAILCHGGGGGSSRAAMDLALALRRRGLPAFLFTLGHLRWRIAPGLPHVCIAPGGVAKRIDDTWSDAELQLLADALCRQCAAHGIGIINFHYAIPFAEACARLRAKMGRSTPAIVATLHGSDVKRAERDGAVRRSLAGALAAADHVCTVSHAYGARVNSLLAAGRNCHVIPNFCRASNARAMDGRALTRHGSARRSFVIIHLSNFRSVKRVHHVAQAFLTLRRERACELWLLGDGPHRRALQTCLQGAGHSVRFFGFREDPTPLLHAADALLLASEAESFSLAALEAMTAGVPVVAPDVEGLNELVRTGEAGLLYTAGRPQHAAAMLLRLITSPQLRRRLSAHAQRISARYSETRTAEAYERLFELRGQA